MSLAEPAPLLLIPEAAFPRGAEAVWYRGAGGRRLRALFCPAPNPTGSVVVSPGRTEHIEKYAEVVHELVERGLNVVVHDWRGQGLSDRLYTDRLRGHAVGFDDFVSDFKALVDLFDDRLPRPRIAMGHSMGGCLTLLALARGEARFDGAILSAPMLGIKTAGQPHGLVRAMAWVMTRIGRGADYILGGATDPFTGTLETDALTHDRVRHGRTYAQLLANRDLALGNVTWGWLDSALTAMKWLSGPNILARVQVPVTIVAAGQDRLVDNAAEAAAATRLPKGRFVEIPGAMHEILMETDELRAPFWREFDALVAAISKPD
ncbi:MAG TPA: alpha/beta hydrolase [Caulobacteraceae bacterium]|nr:alpha/beta hydrolase [Caulobacteraceae bacterium]